MISAHAGRVAGFLPADRPELASPGGVDAWTNLEPASGPLMLERTFVHLKQIGESTERRLWRAGATSWEAFLEDPLRFRPGGRSAAHAIEGVDSSRRHLGRGDYRFFASRLAVRDHWRALSAFPGRIACLDIETDGGNDGDSVTVIGLFDGQTMRHFVRGENLLEFEEALDEVSVLVTFFGGGFDLPVLRRLFPRMPFDQIHLDLCPTLRRLGLAGGLKRIEQAMGLSRGEQTAGLGGWDAVLLWRDWQRGSEKALARLIEYNTEDVMNLVPLARFAFRNLRERLLQSLPEAAR